MIEKPQIAIVGSGIIGTTSALSLSEAGYKVAVISKDQFSETTSAVAATFWYQFKAADTKISTWSEVSLSFFRKEQSIAEAGIVCSNFQNISCPMLHRHGGTRTLSSLGLMLTLWTYLSDDEYAATIACP